MSNKQFNIIFTDEQILEHNESGSKLCFGAGVGPRPDFNVVAHADKITSNVTVSWVDRFKISATMDKFTDRVSMAKFNIVTDPADIKFGEVYTQPPTWVNGRISTATLPNNSFKFVNDTDRRASAVVFKTINGKDSPFYISASPIDSKANELMTPSSVVALWFQRNAQVGTMVSLMKADISIFDLSSRSSVNLKWNGDHFVENN
ncbi:uncharacterized protein FFUJ_03611 [Fusarium fujikuroi IMI 58289]|uniref:Uncharacterized protein n=1 Tax=Gibberella fujikuroi (strain CBS 195.34 / IMI 58289 / NRRL A-6831) TaxID=1279085 RepID=S0DYX2_GIBF5|nr:uncharacterized protein FFUJ_03611 [Fusarium fujikuroi IMI 58289]KLP17250.1 uncharacterized protein LW94_505 [Fusarium fujikuroi]CCT66572.1 uncharacterized protein FFUJ_03611 [Fusarium fujikuroi IMI 58289]SCN81379.1 uncharacterized protein FFM5_02795 [Fusarium fujikuroi]SCO32109.1 uncharacterized protein FFMR_02301 [Fusarium fujikuroi]